MRWKDVVEGTLTMAAVLACLVAMFFALIWPELDNSHYAVVDADTGTVLIESESRDYASDAAVRMLTSRDKRTIAYGDDTLSVVDVKSVDIQKRKGDTDQ